MDIKTNFMYRDEFGNETTLNKTHTEDVLSVTTSLDLLVEDFEAFLTGVGFSQGALERYFLGSKKE